MAFTFIDLFAGIGGLRLGFEKIGGNCVFTSELDKFSVQTYRMNHVCRHQLAGDITMVEAKDIPSHDVLLAGFPCQTFSRAGVSKLSSMGRKHGFECDTRGTLFFDIARILEHHKPRAFLLENVKNLKGHDKGRTFKVIQQSLEELGYSIQHRIINAKSYVPQNRERIFIAGFRDSNGFDFGALDIPDPETGPKMNSVLHPEDGSEDADDRFTYGRERKVHEKYSVSEHMWRYLQDYKEKQRRKGNGFGYQMVGPDDVAGTLLARYYKDGSEILVNRGEGRTPRRLTPRECARLMGFEKPGESRFKITVSDTQAYRQFGNSVVVPVVEAVAGHMREWL